MSPNFQVFVILCIWDTPSENTGLWQLSNVPSAFKRSMLAAVVGYSFQPLSQLSTSQSYSQLTEWHEALEVSSLLCGFVISLQVPIALSIPLSFKTCMDCQSKWCSGRTENLGKNYTCHPWGLKWKLAISGWVKQARDGKIDQPSVLIDRSSLCSTYLFFSFFGFTFSSFLASFSPSSPMSFSRLSFPLPG